MNSTKNSPGACLVTHGPREEKLPEQLACAFCGTFGPVAWYGRSEWGGRWSAFGESRCICCGRLYRHVAGGPQFIESPGRETD